MLSSQDFTRVNSYRMTDFAFIHTHLLRRTYHALLAQLFIQKSSPLKPLNSLTLSSNELWHVGYKDSSFRIDRTKNMAAVAKNRPWGSNSSCSHITRKQKQLSKFREKSYVVQLDKMYLLCNFRDDPWIDVGVIALFISFFFRIFRLWHLITRKRKEQSKLWDILSRSARQDLSAVRIPYRSMKRCWSYCPFNAIFLRIFQFDI